MLHLYKISELPLENGNSLSVYRESRLVNVGFISKNHALHRRNLTRFCFNGNSAYICFELRGGAISGLEMLLSPDFKLDQTVERFSEEIQEKSELPLFSMEFDGKQVATEISLYTISQPKNEFFRWASTTREVEISFGILHCCSNTGSVKLYYNEKMQFSGIRFKLPEDVDLI